MVLRELVDVYTFIQQSDDALVFFSKTVVIALLLYLAVRHLLLANLFRKLKRIDRSINRAVRKYYVRHSWIGWLFFTLGIGIFELLAFKGEWLLLLMSFNTWLLIIFLLFCIGIFYHLYYFTQGIVSVFQQRLRLEKN